MPERTTVTKKTTVPVQGGTAKKIRRSKASQARLDAIVDAIGDDAGAIRRLIQAMAEIDPSIIVINQ